ncbi:hypothetical protein FACS1894139_07310 [Planctomycetales bacterium]|nr:hypothetical protein FACS1894107_11680 [Planctomycetales bacterium]GHT01175.1 hypothetical protein FACS1894108_14580 [Planctomycetales bacterium]GHT04711.1 hypothetical protein FACS1894139_07310 [Planctomycetales bacterium]
MPTLFSFFGMRFQFYSREHLPVHIHVVKGKAVAKFALEPEVALVENNGLKSSEVKLAESIIEENRETIIANWRDFFSGMEPPR